MAAILGDNTNYWVTFGLYTAGAVAAFLVQTFMIDHIKEWKETYLTTPAEGVEAGETVGGDGSEYEAGDYVMMANFPDLLMEF